jgi:hypothetical protein
MTNDPFPSLHILHLVRKAPLRRIHPSSFRVHHWQHSPARIFPEISGSTFKQIRVTPTNPPVVWQPAFCL